MYHSMHGMGDYFLKHGLVFSSNTTKKKMIRYPALSHHLLPLPLGQVWDLLSPFLICEAEPNRVWLVQVTTAAVSLSLMTVSCPEHVFFTVHLLILWLLCSSCFIFGGVPCVLEGVIHMSHLGPNAHHHPLFLDFD